jgi:hypothetical protein
MDLKELLAAVAEYISDDDEDKVEAKAKALAKELRNDAGTKPVATVLRNAGAASKKGEAQTREKELQAEIAKLTEERDDLAGKAEAAASAPNERVAALERERDKYKTQADALKKERDDEKVGRKLDRVTGKRETFVASLIGTEVKPEYERVLRADIAERFRPQEQGEGVEVLDEHGDPIEGDERAQLDSLRASILKVVPPDFRLRPGMQPGGGAGRGGQGTVTREQIMAEKRASPTYRAL